MKLGLLGPNGSGEDNGNQLYAGSVNIQWTSIRIFGKQMKADS
ncbi:MAG: hypothetical protein ACLTDX_22570 [[Clostridium] innocuum]